MKNVVKRMRNRSGFTLLEILIVIVILGVLAGLAIPVYQSTVEKSLKSEALQALGSTRQAAARYYALHNNSYANMTFALLDFDPSAAGNFAGTQHFTYALSDVAAGTFTVTATRNGVGGNGNDTSDVIIKQTGAITGSM